MQRASLYYVVSMFKYAYIIYETTPSLRKYILFSKFSHYYYRAKRIMANLFL